MYGNCQVLAAVFAPFHRASKLHRSEGGDHLFGIDIDFASESPAHFGNNDVGVADPRGKNPYQHLILSRLI